MTPKSHHYNPQVYLRQFVNPAPGKEFWEIDLRQGASVPSSPKKSGCEDFYHSFETPDGRDDSSVEKSFASLENKLPGFFEIIRQKKALLENDWLTLFIFTALQRARSPKALNAIQSGLSKIYAHVFEIMKHSADFDTAMRKKGLDPEQIRNSEIEVKAARGPTLLMLLDVFAGGSLVKVFNRMKWHFLVAPPGTYFWTSDDPVCCWAERDSKSPFRWAVGPENSDAQITFPLSRRTCAYAAWKSPASVTALYANVSPTQVDAINYRTMFNGWKFMYGPTNDPKILAEVKKLIDRRKQKTQPPFEAEESSDSV